MRKISKLSKPILKQGEIKSMVNADNLIWIDLEMTGLNPQTDRILEIATLVTDAQLNLLGEGPVMAIHQSKSLLDNMGEWCQNTHHKSGLTQRVQQSVYTEQQAEQKTLDFLSNFALPGIAPLCGNSIGQDRRFLIKYMPRLNDFFHYRNIDVSSIKELVSRWYPRNEYRQFPKKSSHQALEDIQESILELKHYRQYFFIAPNK